MGNAPVLSRCSLVKKKNPWLKPTGVLEHYREGETNRWVSMFSGRFLLPASLRRWTMSMYRNFPLATIPVNSTSEFRGLLKLLVYKFTCNLVFQFRGSVHHTMIIENTSLMQQDKYVFHLYVFSTCFGRDITHHQELQNCTHSDMVMVPCNGEKFT